MATVLDVKKNLSYLRVFSITMMAGNANAKQLVMLNLSQLLVGENNYGGRFKPYAPWEMEDGTQYAEFKAHENPLPGEGNPDLKLHGDFYKSFKAKINSSGINIDATDEKTAWLTEHYADEQGNQTIFGLKPDNLDIWIHDAFYQDFMKEVTRITGLQFKK